MKRLIARWITLAALGITAPALADDYVAQWGPDVGTPMPVLEAQDHSGQVRSLSNLAGEQGLLLFLNRSADWWPFCKHQLVQLESFREQFESIGVNVAGMTYDSIEILSGFHAEQDLGYPMLRDEQAKHTNALGIRDEQYAEDHPAYGIPHPGIVYIDSAGTIRAKFAVPGYRQRPPFEPLLEHIKTLVK